MQIIKTTSAKAIDSGTDSSAELPLGPQTPVEGDPEIAESVDSFFGEESAATAEPVIPDTPFDLLFSGSPTAPGTISNGPSTSDFAPSKVVTVEDYLIAHPEGRYFLDTFITKMETVRDTRFAREKAGLEGLLAQGGMSPQEALVVQEKIRELDAVINKINQEIEKTKERIADQKGIYTKELDAMKDLNGDGYVGDPRDKENSYIVAKHPVTGETVLLDHNKKPAVDPFHDSEYAPALFGTDSVEFVGDGLPDENGTYNLKLNGTRHATGKGYAENTFGAQIDITAVEGFWAEKHEEDGKIKYIPKPFEVITRADDKQMIGQKAPETEEEKEKYIFVRTTALFIRDEKINKKDKNGVDIDGSDVFFEFQDAEENVVVSLKVEGITANNSSPLASGQLENGQYYIAASTVGVAVNGGLDEEGNPIDHTARIRPMVVDASGFTSTGRVLPELPNHRGEFFEELGIDPVLNGEKGIEGSKLTNDEKNARRAQNAAYYTTHGGFLDPEPRPLKAHHGVESKEEDSSFQKQVKESLYRSASATSEEIAKKFGLKKNGKVARSAVYLSSQDKKYDTFRTGVFIKGIRGVITGTNANDIIVVPPPNQEKLQELLAYGAVETTSDMPTYGTVVKGGSGRNIVVSKGGDLYAEGVSFLWREPKVGEDDGEDQLWIKTNNTHADNQAVFIHIEDLDAKLVHINNGDDSDGLGRTKGVKDDWFETPKKTLFTNLGTDDADLPAGFDTHSGQGAPEVSDQAFTDARNAIDKAIQDFFKIDPMSSEAFIGEEWGKEFAELEATQNSFFDEWDFFNPTEGDDVGDVTDE